MSTNQMTDLIGQLESEIKKLLEKIPTQQDIDMIYHMIKLGANLMTRIENLPEYNVLRHVISFGNLSTFLKFVNEFGYDLELSDDTNNNNPFDYAVYDLQVDIIQWFLDKKLPQQKIQFALMKLCGYTIGPCQVEKAIQVVKLLINSGANILAEEEKSVLELATRQLYPQGAFIKFLVAEIEKAQSNLVPPQPVSGSIQEKSLEELEKDEKINNLINENKKLKQELIDRDAYIDRIAFANKQWKKNIIKGMYDVQEMLLQSC